MPDREIRVALVGCGGMAKRYRTVYARLPGVRWAVAVDPVQGTLDACKAEGAERTSTNFADALAGDVDAVVISTPNHLHAEQSIAALEAGKHILLQKPIANTVDDADRIVAAADAAHARSGVWAAMYMSNYEDPGAWAIKSMIEQGLLGTIQSIRARDAHRGGLTLNSQAWRASRELTGGGSFVQLSIHAINLVTWWLDARVEDIRALSVNRLCPAVGGDDCTVSAVRFSDGTLGTFDSGYASECSTRELYGTRGWVRYAFDQRRIELKLDSPFSFGSFLHYETPGKAATFAIPETGFDDVTNPYNQNVVFIDRLRKNLPPMRSVHHGREDLAVVMKAYESAGSAS